MSFLQPHVKPENSKLNVTVKSGPASSIFLAGWRVRVGVGLHRQTFLKHIGFSASNPTLMLAKWAAQELGLGFPRHA